MRLPTRDRDDLNPEHARVWDSIASTHGGKVSGPFAVWMHSPGVAEGADGLRNSFRDVDLDPRLFQLLVLTVAKHWRAAYPWSVHARTVMSQGLLTAQLLAELAAGEGVGTGDEDVKRLHAIVNELLTTGTMSEDTYADCEHTFGQQLSVEIVTIVGFYSTACLLANAFAIPPVSDVPAGLQGCASQHPRPADHRSRRGEAETPSPTHDGRNYA